MTRRGFLRGLPVAPAVVAASAAAALAQPAAPIVLPRVVPRGPLSSAWFNHLIGDIEAALNAAREVTGITDLHRGVASR